jgi:hypothetical protein
MIALFKNILQRCERYVMNVTKKAEKSEMAKKLKTKEKKAVGAVNKRKSPGGARTFSRFNKATPPLITN